MAFILVYSGANGSSNSLCTYALSELDYFATILNTDRGRCQSGDTIDQGVDKETAGHMDEWDCGVNAADAAPACPDNPARASLCSLRYNGGKQQFRFKLNSPVTQNHNSTPLNVANRLPFVFTRHKPAYYLL